MKIKIYNSINDMLNPEMIQTQEVARLIVIIDDKTYELFERNNTIAISVDAQLIVVPKASNMIELSQERF